MNNDELGEMLRTVLLNQKAILGALSCLHQNTGGMASGYHSNQCKERVRRIEDILDCHKRAGSTGS